MQRFFFWRVILEVILVYKKIEIMFLAFAVSIPFFNFYRFSPSSDWFTNAGVIFFCEYFCNYGCLKIWASTMVSFAWWASLVGGRFFFGFCGRSILMLPIWC